MPRGDIVEKDFPLTSADIGDFNSAVFSIMQAYMGVANGLATLGAGGLLNPSQMPTLLTLSDVNAAVSAAITALVNGAPGALDTIKELADAINDDANYAGTLAAQIASLQSQITTLSGRLTRTTSALSLSLVGTGATGTQISSTKDSTVRVFLSESTTATIGGASVSDIYLKKCATNSATETDWSSVLMENTQTISLAIVLQSIQGLKGELEFDLPAGWWVKLVNTGSSGTHTETVLGGEKTVYG